MCLDMDIFTCSFTHLAIGISGHIRIYLHVFASHVVNNSVYLNMSGGRRFTANAMVYMVYAMVYSTAQDETNTILTDSFSNILVYIKNYF